MGRGKQTADAKEVLFKRLYGVKPDTFHKMLSILQKEFDALHKNGDKPPKLTPEDKLYISLKYLREYRTMYRIAAEYGVCKGTVCLAIQWVEDTLVKDGTCALPGKKALKRTSESIQYIVVDVTESPINRPKEGQKAYYSEKKRHTLRPRSSLSETPGRYWMFRRPKAESMTSKCISTASGVRSAIRYPLMRIGDTLG
jgi:hypothetical protein